MCVTPWYIICGMYISHFCSSAYHLSGKHKALCQTIVDMTVCVVKKRMVKMDLGENGPYANVNVILTVLCNAKSQIFIDYRLIASLLNPYGMQVSVFFDLSIFTGSHPQ